MILRFKQVSFSKQIRCRGREESGGETIEATQVRPVASETAMPCASDVQPKQFTNYFLEKATLYTHWLGRWFASLSGSISLVQVSSSACS